MYVGGDWRRPPMPAQFAVRVAVLGGFALVMFAVIFFRLWYLEVLSGDRYLAEAQNNQVREFTVQAPRGEITDRDGTVLVTNRTALELQVKPTELPRPGPRRRRVFERLSEVAGMSTERIRREIRRQTRELPASPVALKRDVSYELVYFLRENQSRFPGVSVERVYVRRYPKGTLGAHLFGYVREVDAEELENPRYESLGPGDMVGKEGVEYSYDNLLRGVNVATRVQVDATGRPTGGGTLSVREARAGNNLALSIDADVQEVGQRALSSFGKPGGFVAMNVNSGEVLGMGSNPSYDPAVFAKPVVPKAVYEQLTSDATSAPITNRAVQGLYPTGSTFKAITAVAALADDDVNFTPQTVINDPGQIQIADQVFKNAGEVAHGPVALRKALQVSSDVFFYTLGRDMNTEASDGGSLQAWAKQLGIGSATGIDLLGEGAGLLPTPAWRNENFEKNTDPDGPCGSDVCVEKGELTDRPWSVGDNVQLAIGQGDLQANPLQMAVAYAAIANGGKVVRPHVGLQAEDPGGRVIQEIEPAPRREVAIQPDWQREIMEGLRDAAMSPGGTSYPIFGGFPVDIAGKTGTAERPGRPNDQSWYVALAPYPDPQYVVAVTIEDGGFGADAAAPAAQKILIELLNVKEKKIKDVGDQVAVYE
jgi:penicillin-binding protein 2